MRPNQTSHKFRPLSDWLWSVPLNASWYEFFMNYWELCFLLWHETTNSCVKVSFPVMHCLHFHECCLPEPGLSCLLMNFCSCFICWIFTTSHCWFLASFLFVLPLLTQVQLCFSGIPSLTMHKYRMCCPILPPPPKKKHVVQLSFHVVKVKPGSWQSYCPIRCFQSIETAV